MRDSGLNCTARLGYSPADADRSKGYVHHASGLSRDVKHDLACIEGKAELRSHALDADRNTALDDDD